MMKYLTFAALSLALLAGATAASASPAYKGYATWSQQAFEGND